MKLDWRSIMNIKSLLIGSAAALAAVSGAQAADAIVAAEPEPLEYVRVCDAFGAGFFYIPGGETCLKIGGYVRFQTDFGRDRSGTSDWNSFTRAQLEIDTKTDTDLGTLRGFIGLRGNAGNGASSSSSVFVDQAFIELGGLKVGKFYSWWDDGIAGETDVLSTNALFNSIRYTYEAGAFSVGVSVDELEGIRFSQRTGTTVIGGTTFTTFGLNEGDNNVGVAANVAFALGGAKLALLGSYDTDQEEGAIRAILTAPVGPGSFELAGVWASGSNAYYAESEWTVAAAYAIKATDKLTITPGAQYFGNVAGRNQIALDTAGVRSGPSYISSDDWTNDDAWKVGVTARYDITQGLYALATVNYVDQDHADDQTTGFLRLQRSF
jgi:hypothetical protein